jgi:hypothetical protein
MTIAGMDKDNKVSSVPDPFFAVLGDSTWNACIGPQGNVRNYVDGYIEAALELATLVIEKNLMASRDTLVLPILYTARHGVELALKLATSSLTEAGVFVAQQRVNHDIDAYWRALKSAHVGDEAIRVQLEALSPFVQSLAAIDDDGQQLRYATGIDGAESLAGRPLANIQVIQQSLKKLRQILGELQRGVYEFTEHLREGTRTLECSRRDLLEIAKLLPRKANWSTAAFDGAKVVIKARYGLSGSKFSAALDAIQTNREMNAALGVETPLAHLSDEHLRLIAEEWSACNPPRVRGGESVVLGSTLFKVARGPSSRSQAATRLAAVLSPHEVADLEVIFYLGRDGWLPETYEAQLERTLREHAVQGDIRIPLQHVFTKMNLLRCLVIGLRRLGRPSLAEQLRDLRPDAV